MLVLVLAYLASSCWLIGSVLRSVQVCLANCEAENLLAIREIVSVTLKNVNLE
jgi:hypothetical protein